VYASGFPMYLCGNAAAAAVCMWATLSSITSVAVHTWYAYCMPSFSFTWYAYCLSLALSCTYSKQPPAGGSSPVWRQQYLNNEC
jgi:hypothetical protein